MRRSDFGYSVALPMLEDGRLIDIRENARLLADNRWKREVLNRVLQWLTNLVVTDSIEGMDALGNSWATNCAEWVLRRIVAAIRLGMA